MLIDRLLTAQPATQPRQGAESGFKHDRLEEEDEDGSRSCGKNESLSVWSSSSTFALSYGGSKLHSVGGNVHALGQGSRGPAENSDVGWKVEDEFIRVFYRRCYTVVPCIEDRHHHGRLSAIEASCFGPTCFLVYSLCCDDFRSSRALESRR